MKDCFKKACDNCIDSDFEECQKIQTAVLEKLDESVAQNYEPMDYFLKEMRIHDSIETMAL